MAPPSRRQSGYYSAGAALHEMITGRVPFRCKRQYELMNGARPMQGRPSRKHGS